MYLLALNACLDEQESNGLLPVSFLFPCMYIPSFASIFAFYSAKDGRWSICHWLLLLFVVSAGRGVVVVVGAELLPLLSPQNYL